MPRAGDYRNRFEVLVHSETKGATGGVDESWEYAGLTCWGALEELSGTARLIARVTTDEVGCTIRLRGFPTVRRVDRLRDKLTGDLYRIDGLRLGDNETLCDATRTRAETAARG